MNTFTIEKYGDTQYQLQCANKSGFGTCIICTADELAQLRKLLAPMEWKNEPSGEGRYVYMLSPDLPDTAQFVNIIDWEGIILASYRDDDDRIVKPGGLWLKLPDVPEGK